MTRLILNWWSLQIHPTLRRLLHLLWSGWEAGVLLPLDFVYTWAITRPLRRLAWGFVPLVVGVLFALVVVSGAWLPQGELRGRYQRAANAAVASEDPEAAEMWLRKVSVLDGRVTPDIRYAQGIAAAQRGDLEGARKVMQELAPLAGGGLPDAHLWLAQDLLAQPESRSEEEQEQLRQHLSAALDQQPENAPVRALLAGLLVQQRQFTQAVEHLEILVRESPLYTDMLARLYGSLSQPEEARRVVQSGIERLERLHKQQPEDVLTRLHLARLHGQQGNFPSAVTLLSEGLVQLQRQLLLTSSAPLETSATDQEQHAAVAQARQEQFLMLRGELTGALLGWDAHLARTEPGNLEMRLTLMRRALQVDPGSAVVMERLAQMAGGDGQSAVDARLALNDALTRGQATPLVHLLLGLAALKQQDSRAEEHHLRLALAADPSLIIASNNLAWLLAQREPPELGEALQLIEQAVRQVPEHPALRSTRGHIYERLQRRHEAIIDLEFALARQPERGDLNEALARLYAGIGNEEQATRHRQLAEQKGAGPVPSAGSKDGRPADSTS